MCLTIVVTLLDSTKEIQPVLYSQFIVGAPVWSANCWTGYNTNTSISLEYPQY